MTTKLYNELDINSNNIINANLVHSSSIGVGILSPSGTVHILGTGATANDFIVENTTSGTSARARVRVVGDGGYGHFEFRSASSTNLPGVLQIAADTNIVINPGNGAAALAVFAADSLTINKPTIVTGGTLQLFNSGATGYLTNQTNALLYFSQSGGTYPFDGNGNLVLQSRTSTGNARDIVFATGDTTPATRMVIDSSGNVGIGITSPSNLLEVGGTLGALSGTRVTSVAASGLAGFDAGTDVDNRAWMIWDSTSKRLRFGTRETATTYDNTLTIKSGNVGINTDSPSQRLEVADTIPYIRLTSTKTGGNSEGDIFSGIEFYSNDPDMPNLPGVQAYIKVIHTRAGTNHLYADAGMIFGTIDNTGSLAERVRITSEGNVGIGTSSPGAKLEVSSSSSADGIIINNTATDGDPYLSFALSGTKKFTMGVDDGDEDKFKIGTTAIGTSTALTINSSGQIGIGTTSPSNLFEIEVGGITRYKVDSSGNNVIGGHLIALYHNTYDIGAPGLTWKNIYLTNNPVVGSDRRIKENIQESDLGLDFINKLIPRKYDKIKTGSEPDSDTKNQYGLIAQELEEVLIELGVEFGGLVYSEDVDRYSIRYTELISPIIKSIQELDQKYNNIITTLMNKVDELTNRLNNLEGDF